MALLPIFRADISRTNRHNNLSVKMVEHTSSRFVAGELNPEVMQDLTKIVDFMGKDPDRIVFRRFSRANLYNLLVLQHRVTLIDQQVASYEEKRDTEALIKILPALETSMKIYSKPLPLNNTIVLTYSEMRPCFPIAVF